MVFKLKILQENKLKFTDMRKKSLFVCLLSLFTLSFSSCEDESYDFLGNAGKVYVRIQDENMVNSVPNLSTSSISINSMGIFGEAKVEFPVRSTMPAQGVIEVTVGIDNSLVDVYNQSHGTKYLPLNADVVSFDENLLHIQEGQMRSSNCFKAHLDISKIQSLELGEYLVPLRLQTTSSMEISENWNTMYWLITVSEGADDVPLADRTGWAILGCSSEDEYEENLAVNVLDGSMSTCWHTEWYAAQPEPPHFISIDMGKEVSLAGFQYVTRNRNTGVPSEMIFSISSDGQEWSDVNTYTDLPSGVNAEFRTLFDKSLKARYFRLTITKIYNEEHFTSLSEINAFVINN